MLALGWRDVSRWERTEIIAVSLQHDLDALGQQREQVVLQPPDRLLDLILGLHANP